MGIRQDSCIHQFLSPTCYFVINFFFRISTQLPISTDNSLLVYCVTYSVVSIIIIITSLSCLAASIIAVISLVPLP